MVINCSLCAPPLWHFCDSQLWEIFLLCVMTNFKCPCHSVSKICINSWPVTIPLCLIFNVSFTQKQKLHLTLQNPFDPHRLFCNTARQWYCSGSLAWGNPVTGKQFQMTCVLATAVQSATVTSISTSIYTMWSSRTWSAGVGIFTWAEVNEYLSIVLLHINNSQYSTVGATVALIWISTMHPMLSAIAALTNLGEYLEPGLQV